MRRTARGRRASGRAGPVRTSRRRYRTGSRRSACGSTSGVQPVAASRASVSRSTISSSRPTSLRDAGAGNPRRCSAARQASVAISRARVTPRLRILSRQMPAPRRRAAIAASLSRPEAERPSPSRMMRENASMTRKPSRGRRAPPAAGNCWCRDRAPHRSGRTRPARLPAVMRDLARMPIRRPPAPPRPCRAPVRHGVEAGRPGLVVHRKPFPAPKPSAHGSARRRGGDFTLRSKV